MLVVSTRTVNVWTPDRVDGVVTVTVVVVLDEPSVFTQSGDDDDNEYGMDNDSQDLWTGGRVGW